MPEAIIATVAVGASYTAMAAEMLHLFADAGNTTLVVTDDPRPFDERIIAVPYVPDGTHIWHAKRFAVREGLARADTVWFIDSDYKAHPGWETRVPKMGGLAPGLHGIHYPGPLDQTTFADLGRIAFYPEAVCFLDEAARAVGLADWRQCLWWGDHIYAVAKDDQARVERFMAAWETLARLQPSGALFARPRLYAGGDGVAMALAAAAADLQPCENRLAFTPIRRAFWHASVGAYRNLPVPARPLPTA